MTRLFCAALLACASIPGPAFAAVVRTVSVPASGTLVPGVTMRAAGTGAAGFSPLSTPYNGLPGSVLPDAAAPEVLTPHAPAFAPAARPRPSAARPRPSAARPRPSAEPIRALPEILKPAPRAGAAAPAASMKLEAARPLAAGTAKSEGADSKGAWDGFWSALSPRPSAGPVASIPEAAAGRSRPSAARRSPLSRSFKADHDGSRREAPVPAPMPDAAVPVAGLTAAVGPAIMTALSWPYVQAAGTLLGAYLAARLLKAGLRRFWNAKDLDKNLLMVAELAVDFLVWAGGGTAALRLAGMDWSTLFASLGIGGLAVTMAVKEFVGNFIRGVFLLLQQPFKVGEKITIDKKEYQVIDMTFRYMVLRQTQGDFTLMTYSKLAGKPVTLSREYEARPEAGSPDPEAGSPDPEAGSERAHARAHLWKRAALILALGALTLGGGLWLQAAMPASAPYLYAAGTLGVTWIIERLLSRALAKLAVWRHWDPNTAAVLRLALSGAAYLAGLAAGLRLAGLAWSSLLTGAGVLGIVAGVAASDLLSNMLQAVWLLLSRPFRLGDRIEVAGQTGTVSYMNLRYVVLDQETGDGVRSTLIPYAVIQDSPIKVLKTYLKGRPADDGK